MFCYTTKLLMPNLRSTQILLTVCYREMTVSKRNFSVRCAALCYATLATTSIGGDTKAAARQSPNCIWRITIFNMADRILTLCNVARTWHEMLLNSPKCPPYWNSTSGFDFDHNHRSRHVLLHQSAKFYPNRTTLGKKWRHVDFQDGGCPPSWMSNNGFFEKPMYDFL